MERNTLDQHVLAPIRSDQRRSQVMPESVNSLLDRRYRRSQWTRYGALLLQHRAVGNLIRQARKIPRLVRIGGGRRAAEKGIVAGSSLPPPPRRRIALPVWRSPSLPVERALAGDRDVLFTKGVDQRRKIEQIVSFPARQHQRIFS